MKQIEGLTGEAGEVFEAFGRKFVREFGKAEYGPMIVDEPDYDLLDNWNHWYTLGAVMLAIGALVAWVTLHRVPVTNEQLAKLRNQCAVLSAVSPRSPK